MTLKQYLERKGESQAAFARRIGIERATLGFIFHGGGCHVATAIKIVKATRGKVGYADLVGDKKR